MMFRNQVELGKFLGSVDIIHEAYGAISKRSSETNSSTYKLETTPSGITVLSFNCSPDDTARFLEGKNDLINSLEDFNNVPSKELDIINFISTKANSSFSINKVVVKLFKDLGNGLKEIENKHIQTPLIITGSGLGGCLAILFTLRLHHAIDVKESSDTEETNVSSGTKESKESSGTKKAKESSRSKRPICITFGAPLVGDAALQLAIAERPQWRSSFLNVVAMKDHIASVLSSNTAYKPLGTFLFCTEAGGHSAFVDQDSILGVLDSIKLPSASRLQIYDYMNVLGPIKRKVLYRGVSNSSEPNKLNPLWLGIKLQLEEVGVLGDISDDQIDKMEKKHVGLIKKKNLVSAYEPTKKLNEIKISLTYMEWYMKTRKEEGGYYDSYKGAKSIEELRKKNIIIHHKRILNQYWKKIVEEKDLMPQKEGAKLRDRWLYNGNNYRRIVEPLDIAEYYKNGSRNYIISRPDHYRLLEKWSDEDKKNSKSSKEKRIKAASLTEDSCFWAHVEEALILLENLKNGGSSDIEKELEQFETYVMCAIEDYSLSLSLDVFLKGSSLMEWWKKYKAHKGTAYASEFAQFMNKRTINRIIDA